jgi:DNA-directed RNA polymerase subunit RPC12/RpoP
MSEFKFFCSQCGQHLSADESWAGKQIQCPSCQAPLVVPQMAVAAAPAAPKLATATSPPPVIPTSQPAFTQPSAPTIAAPVRSLSLMALASLVLVLATLPLNLVGKKVGWPLGLLGFIPGILCGHAALAELRSNRRLMGAPLAWIGLVLGYLILIITLVGLAFYGYRRFVKKEEPAMARKPPYTVPGITPANPNFRASPNATVPNQPAPTPVPRRPTDPKVTTNPLTAEIPNAALSGTVLGGDFKADTAVVTAQGLELKQGQGSFPDASVILFLFASGQPLDGRKFVFSSQSSAGIRPHVHVRRKEGGKVNVASSNYALRLEFGQRQGDKLPGRIFLELPQRMETKLAGTFEATVSP